MAGSALVGGSADGSVFAARFLAPFSINVSSSGDIYLADTVNEVLIRKISALGVVNTLGGVPLLAGSADGAGASVRKSRHHKAWDWIVPVTCLLAIPATTPSEGVGPLWGVTDPVACRLTVSPSPTPSPGPGPSQPLNISTRLRVETGQNVMIGGFIITGNDPKKVILRAIGPSLAGFGILYLLPDPVLELHGSDGSSITTNDNWKDTQQSEIEATGLQPQNDLEAAIVRTLDPDSYTAIVSGKGETSGVGLVEVYDLDQAVDSILAKIRYSRFGPDGR